MSWPGSASTTISPVHRGTFELLTFKRIILIITVAFLYFCNVIFFLSYSGIVVERIDSCASMYSRSIQGHHVCLLVKTVSEPSLDPERSRKNINELCFRSFFPLQSGQTVSIDAKCDEPTLLGNVLDEIKQTFSQC